MAEKEYKGDMKHNLAEMYAKNMVDYGVDVTKAWQTATQQSYALEKAYIRGRQHEADRLEELKPYRASAFSGDMTQKMLKEEYNKAIDDFKKEIKNLIIDLNVIKFKDIDEIAEHLKVGDNS